MIVGPAEYYNIIIDLMDYFIQEEGWKQEYAHQVLAKQCSDIGRELRARKDGLAEPTECGGSHKVLEEGVEYFKSHAEERDYKALVKRLCTILTPYKPPDRIREMRRGLNRIMNPYLNPPQN